MSYVTLDNLLNSLSFPFLNSTSSLFTIKLVLGLNKKISVKGQAQGLFRFDDKTVCFLPSLP